MADKIAMIAGHRPEKLFGYDLMNEKYLRIRMAIRDILTREDAIEFWTGLEPACGMLGALVAVDMQENSSDIKLNIAIPGKDHKDYRWPQPVRDLYDAVLYRSDRADMLTDDACSTWVLEQCRRYMADQCDFAIIIYNGTPGATANCIKYLRKTGKAIWFIDPYKPGNPVFVPAPNRH